MTDSNTLHEESVYPPTIVAEVDVPLTQLESARNASALLDIQKAEDQFKAEFYGSKTGQDFHTNGDPDTSSAA